MMQIKIDYRLRGHITGSVVALIEAIHNIKINFLHNSKNLIGYYLTINLSGSSKLLRHIIRFIDKPHADGKLFNMVTLNFVSKVGEELGLLYLID